MANEDAPGNAVDRTETLQELSSINLIDHTAPPLDDATGSDTELSSAPSKITKTATHGSIRQTIARRKYGRSKWQEGKGIQSGIRFNVGEAEGGEPSTTEQAEPTFAEPQEQDGMDSDNWGQGPIRRRGRKVKDAIRMPKPRSSKPDMNEPGAHIDILYENQRGFFFMGIPRFSSNSLLNFDPGAWLDSRYRPSAVNITNAQVPDPSWEWAWRCWYVDMSGDVDEEGWEYSFWFGKSCAWHGTHPWFHSFVRRRRWLRKRTKRKTSRAKDDAHALTSDYFTIHSKMTPGAEDAGSITTSEKRAQYSVATSSAWGAKSWEDQTADMTEVNSIPDLLRELRAAAIDREKMVLVRRFLDQGGAELHYLAENMEQIMKLLVFQNSRRQLLSMLMHEFEAAEQHRDEHKERGEAESDDEKQHIDNLLKAVEAADEQCKSLEYWSDVRDMARDGEVLRAADHTHGWDHSWQGLDASGPEKPGGSPTDTPSDSEEGLSEKIDKGKQPARSAEDNDKPAGWSDGATDARSTTKSGPNEISTSRPSEDSARKDHFYSPEATPRLPTEGPTPSQESEMSFDTFASAQSEQEDEDEGDDQATERAPSEDEGEIENTPPAGTTPIEGLIRRTMSNGQTAASTDDKGTATSQQS